MTKLLPVFLAAALVAEPALAASPAPDPKGAPPQRSPAPAVVQAKSPALAATLTAAAPPVMFVTAVASMPLIGAFGAPLGLAAPFGVSAGYFYAGEPWRGTWVGLGSYAIFGTAFAATYLLGGSAEGQIQTFPLMMTGASLAFIGYTVWAATDVYRVTVEKNKAAATPAQPQ